VTSYLDDLIITTEISESGRVEIAPDGREVHQERIVYTEKGIGWLRAGYLCIRCLADLHHVGAFPEECPSCRFPVRELQILKFNRDFAGDVGLGSKVSLSDELSRLGEMYIPGQGA
jgi:hypothetical protein